ncbi:putative receptor like protein 25 [Eucalyptus grandis]|uniref:putative receptor like protein 25 n=1 Tax=Eucalyptus grandis TaxID=71139 RepID=UPI00192EAC2D|nr:putative receptor like protein 25 [Eucalyptus grandis]
MTQELGLGMGFYEDSINVIMKGREIRLERILTILTTIDLSLNSFQGNIPSVIGNLHFLKGLNLSYNHLMGSIPSTLGNLTNLEWLDLSSNKLSGRVPRELGDLSFLGCLDLSRNQLVGPIPQDKQLSTFTSDSFRGNPGLCGTPLQITCRSDAQPPPTSQSFFQEDSTRVHGGGFDRKVVGIGYASGIVIGISIAYILCETGRPKWLVREVRRMERRAKLMKKPKWKAIKFHGAR